MRFFVDNTKVLFYYYLATKVVGCVPLEPLALVRR